MGCRRIVGHCCAWKKALADGAAAIFDHGNGTNKGKEQKNSDALVARLYQQIMHGRASYGCDIAPEYVDIQLGSESGNSTWAVSAPDVPWASLSTTRRSPILGALMQIKARYSHLNGEEYLIVHRKQLWEEVQTVIAEVDAFSCRTKVSREKTMQGKMLFSPADMNQAFKGSFQ